MVGGGGGGGGGGTEEREEPKLAPPSKTIVISIIITTTNRFKVGAESPLRPFVVEVPRMTWMCCSCCHDVWGKQYYR